MEMTYFILTTEIGFYSRKANITELPKEKLRETFGEVTERYSLKR